MRLTLPWLGCLLMLAMAGCSPKPSAAQLHAARLKMDPVIAFLDTEYVATGRPLPQDEELRRAYTEKTKAEYPRLLIYAPTEEVPGQYKMWLYVKMRTSLWYVSKADNREPKGWSLDYDDGSEGVEGLDP